MLVLGLVVSNSFATQAPACSPITTPTGDLIGNPPKRYALATNQKCSSWHHVFYEKEGQTRDYCGVQYVEAWATPHNQNVFADTVRMTLETGTPDKIFIRHEEVKHESGAYVALRLPANQHLTKLVRGCVVRKTNTPIDVNIQVKYWKS